MVISGVLSALLSLIAFRFRALTFWGAVASFFVGYIVGIFGSVEWLILLVSFTIVGLIITKMDLSDKVRNDLIEGYGERSHLNVLGVGLPACIIAILYSTAQIYFGKQYDFALTVAFICTLAVAAADTVASEIGIRDKKVWLITTFERVKRGTDGGISVLGTLSSLVASVFTCVIGWLLLCGDIDIYILVPITMGFLGNIIDSLLGATLESKGKISKYTNNCTSAMVGAALGALIIIFL
jgi:Predicted membrane protein